MSGTNGRFNDHQEIQSPQSSDEKMDTGSESYRSTQNTPNSTLSSDFDDKDQCDEVLRLQNPDEPASLKIGPKRLMKTELNNSFITKMSTLRLNSLDVPDNNKPKMETSPPKVCSTLTSTMNHPLMGLGSPDSVKNYPELLNKSIKNIEENDLCRSITEDEKNTNDSSFINFVPQRNTSKNNLYFSENFTTADSNDTTNIDSITPLPRPMDRRKIIPLLDEDRLYKDTSTPIRNIDFNDIENRDVSAINPVGKSSHMDITPRKDRSSAIDITGDEEFHSGVGEWCESPSQLRLVPNFELPIEMTSNFAHQDKLESPGDQSQSEDRSAYQARLDPYSGHVTLKHTPANRSGSQQRRKITLPPEQDSCSLDSLSGCSLESDDEDVQVQDPLDLRSEGEDRDKRNSLSSYSDPIPEYSAAEEYDDERSWIKVKLPNGEHATCDLRVIEPYKRVLSHGGYAAGGVAVIVVSSCHLPAPRTDYHYVMRHLFLYALWTLDRLVTDQYVLVYLHHGAKAPTARWILESYRLVDRRLRKSMKHLFLVHPTFWLKSIVALSKPFVSAKFFKKITYVKNLAELNSLVTVEPNAIPETVRRYDEERFGR